MCEQGICPFSFLNSQCGCRGRGGEKDSLTVILEIASNVSTTGIIPLIHIVILYGYMVHVPAPYPAINCFAEAPFSNFVLSAQCFLLALPLATELPTRLLGMFLIENGNR